MHRYSYRWNDAVRRLEKAGTACASALKAPALLS
jgi:hypothetical protein